MNKYSDNNRVSQMVFISCWLMYTIICMTKNGFSTSLVAIVNEGGFSKSSVGIISSSFYFFYGTGQLFGGYFADRFSPFKIVAIGLAGSILANSCMSLCQNFTIMLISWSFNGAIQFGIWPSILKILSTVLIKEHRKKAYIYISTCFCTGTLLSYLCAIVILNNFQWKYMFYVSTALLIFILGIWIFVSKKVNKNIPIKDESKKEPNLDNTSKSHFFKIMLISGVCFLLIPALIRSMLDTGIKTWVPTMIMESYAVTPGFASLLTTALLVVNLFGVYFATWIYPKRMKDEVSAITCFFAVSLPLLCIMLFIRNIPLFIIIILLACTTTFMYAINQLINIYIPTRFAKYKKVGTIAGILNALACYGCVFSSFGYGYLAEKFGWTGPIISWIILSLIGIIFCLFTLPLWKKFINKE